MTLITPSLTVTDWILEPMVIYENQDHGSQIEQLHQKIEALTVEVARLARLHEELKGQFEAHKANDHLDFTSFMKDT